MDGDADQSSMEAAEGEMSESGEDGEEAMAEGEILPVKAASLRLTAIRPEAIFTGSIPKNLMKSSMPMSSVILMS